MNYFDLLGLSREPFSSSPDPAFFYESANHVQCLHRLEIAIRLRRGLNVCLGEIGTGKTTLCRTLIQHLDRDKNIVTRLILDPYFTTGLEFLNTLHASFLGRAPSEGTSQWEVTEAIKKYLFHEGLEKNKTVALIVDEGQKLCLDCLEVLRELLNYETNDAKLLQVVIFAQNEFEATLAQRPNFRDRVNEFCRLGPLGFRETKALIRHRLQLAGTTRELFTRPAYKAMYRASQGHPRKIMHLGHKVLMSLIMNNSSRASRGVVVACAKAQGYIPRKTSRLAWLLGLLALTLAVGAPIALLDKEKNNQEPIHALSRQTWPVQRAEETPATPESAAENEASQPAPLSIPGPEAESDISGHVETADIFFAQIGSFQVESNARALASEFKSKAYPAEVKKILRGDQLWFLVTVQAFAEKSHAVAWTASFKEREQRDALVVELSEDGYRVVSHQ